MKNQKKSIPPSKPESQSQSQSVSVSKSQSPPQSQPIFLKGDIREVRLNKRFDAVIALFQVNPIDNKPGWNIWHKNGNMC